MPESRKANTLVHCSFCGQYKDNVPLLITSIQSNSCICSWCALGVVNQTFQHMTKIEGMLRDLMRGPQIEVASSVESPDALDVAINRALKGNRDGG